MKMKRSGARGGGDAGRPDDRIACGSGPLSEGPARGGQARSRRGLAVSRDRDHGGARDGEMGFTRRTPRSAVRGLGAEPWPVELLSGRLEHLVIEVVLDPEAGCGADLVQLGAQGFDPSLLFGSHQDADSARFLDPKGRRDAPCLGLVQQREAAWVLDRQGDDLGFPFVELMSKRLQQRLVGGHPHLQPSMLACGFQFGDAGPVFPLIDDLAPDRGGDGQLAIEIFEQGEASDGGKMDQA